MSSKNHEALKKKKKKSLSRRIQSIDKGDRTHDYEYSYEDEEEEKKIQRSKTIPQTTKKRSYQR